MSLELRVDSFLTPAKRHSVFRMLRFLFSVRKLAGGKNTEYALEVKTMN